MATTVTGGLEVPPRTSALIEFSIRAPEGVLSANCFLALVEDEAARQRAAAGDCRTTGMRWTRPRAGRKEETHCIRKGGGRSHSHRPCPESVNLPAVAGMPPRLVDARSPHGHSPSTARRQVTARKGQRDPVRAAVQQSLRQSQQRFPRPDFRVLDPPILAPSAQSAFPNGESWARPAQGFAQGHALPQGGRGKGKLKRISAERVEGGLARTLVESRARSCQPLPILSWICGQTFIADRAIDEWVLSQRVRPQPSLSFARFAFSVVPPQRENAVLFMPSSLTL